MAARAGFCSECGEDVWLKDGGGCVRNHDPRSVQSARVVPLPSELDKFNWGAFFFPVLWPLFKGPLGWAGVFFGLAILERLVDAAMPPEWWIPSAVVYATGFGLSIWYARNANRLQWEAKPWTINPPAHLKSQRYWGVAGLVINGAILALVGLAVVLGI